MGAGNADVDLVELVERVDRLERRNSELEQRNAALEARFVDADPPPPAPRVTPDRAVGRIGRRQVLTTGVVAAGAAAGAVLWSAAPAGAANGSNLVIGAATNVATSATGLEVDGSSATYGLGATDNGYGGAFPVTAALFGHAKGTNFQSAVLALGEKGARGVFAQSDTGFAVEGDGRVGGAFNGTDAAVFAKTPGGIAVQASSDTGYAATFDSPYVQIGLSGTRPAPTSDSAFHAAGHLILDDAADLWLCVVGGLPGTFRKLSGPKTAGQLHALTTPVRVYDSRPGTSPSGGSKTPLPANTARSIDLKNASSGVPADAVAVAVNVLLLNAKAGNGNFTVWANGATRPLANTLVWGGSAGRFSTFAITGVDATAFCQVQASLQTDLTVDVVGYYR